MVLKYQISPYPSLMEDLIVKIWEAENDTPGAEVYTQTLPQAGGGGHPDITTVVVNGLDRVVHIVRLYTADSAQKLHEYNAEPKVDIVTIFDPIRFKIGDDQMGTPAPGTNSYQNDLLIGLEVSQFIVMRNDKGFMFPDLHYIFDDDAGIIALTNGDVWDDNDEITIMLQPKVVTTVVNDSVVGKLHKGFTDINTNMNYAAAHLRTLLRFTAAVAYTFNATVPIGYIFCFTNMQTALNGTINFTFAPLKWGGATVSTFTLPQYTQAAFSFDGTNWNVVYFGDCRVFQEEDPNEYLPGQIIAQGLFHIGQLPAGMQFYTITHNKNIPGDYIVLLSRRSNQDSTVFSDNDVDLTWKHSVGNKPNAFTLMAEERNSGTQNLSACWIIIKL